MHEILRRRAPRRASMLVIDPVCGTGGMFINLAFDTKVVQSTGYPQGLCLFLSKTGVRVAFQSYGRAEVERPARGTYGE